MSAAIFFLGYCRVSKIIFSCSYCDVPLIIKVILSKMYVLQLTIVTKQDFSHGFQLLCVLYSMTPPRGPITGGCFSLSSAVHPQLLVDSVCQTNIIEHAFKVSLSGGASAKARPAQWPLHAVESLLPR